MTERLILRQWREGDHAPWAALCGDPEVMRYFPSVQSPEEASDFIARRSKEISDKGYGFFALEEKKTGAFVGMTGITWPGFDTPFPIAMEVGWRLPQHAWGKGYASEAARACLIFARDVLEQPQVVSFTAAQNNRSMAVMERIGMTRDLDGDFNHPSLEAGHPLERHVLYRTNFTSS